MGRRLWVQRQEEAPRGQWGMGDCVLGIPMGVGGLGCGHEEH